MTEREVKVACLYRVSTKKQVEENDIPMQKNACKAFIDKQAGWVFAREYAEKGVSGYHKSAEQRDVLQQVKGDAENGLFDVLLVFMFDRLGRREDETPFVVEWFVRQGIEVWSVTEGQQKFENSADKLMNYIRFWQSGGESEKTSIRVAEKHRQMVEEGKFRGGAPPYGYTLVKSGRQNAKGYELKAFAILPNESGVVRMIFDLAANHGYGGHRIAGHLNEKGILTKKGNAWTAVSVLNLLKNPIYKGYYVSGKRKSERGQRKRMAAGQWTFSREKLTELAIVDEALWDKAEAVRNARKPGSSAAMPFPRQTKGPLLLVGLASCGYCGGMLASRYALKKWTRKKSGEQMQYLQPTYICRKKSAKRPCNGPTTYSQRKIDPVLSEEISGYLRTLKAVDLCDEFRIKRREAVKAEEQSLEDAQRRVAKVQTDIELLGDEILRCLAGNSHFTQAQLSGMIAQKEQTLILEKQNKAALEARLWVRAREEPPEAQNDRVMTPDWGTEFEEAPQAVKKMLLTQIIREVKFYKGGIDVFFAYNLYDERVGNSKINTPI